MKFIDKVKHAQQHNQTDVVLFINPRVLEMPLPMKQNDDPFLPFGKAIIAATRDLVCGYMFDLASYMVMGAAGMIALERTIAYADAATILHGPFSGAGYVHVMDEDSFNADAVTLAQGDDLPAYLRRPDKGVFVMNLLMPQAGAYFPDEGHNRLILPDSTLLRVVGEQVLYAGYGEDFAEQARKKMMEKRRD